jgi:hypothetical protein
MNTPAIVTSHSVPFSAEEIRQLEKNYQIKNLPEVLEFIAQHPELLPVLQEAPAQIEVYFPGQGLSLEVDYDPEIKDWVYLVISILTAGEAREVLDQLHRLDYEWALPLPITVKENLMITLGYPT